MINDNDVKEERLVKKVIKMGKDIRKKNELRERQPLKTLIVSHPDLQVREILYDNSDLIRTALNVKLLMLNENPIKLKFRANYGKLGPKFKRRVRDISLEIEKITPQEWAANTQFLILGEIIYKDEIIVDSSYSLDSSETDGDLNVRLEFYMDNDLLQEGMIEEVIPIFKEQRKLLGLNQQEPIEICWFSLDVDLSNAISSKKEFLEQELNATLYHEYDVPSQRLIVDCFTGEKDLLLKIKNALF